MSRIFRTLPSGFLHYSYVVFAYSVAVRMYEVSVQTFHRFCNMLNMLHKGVKKSSVTFHIIPIDPSDQCIRCCKGAFNLLSDQTGCIL